MQAEESRTVAMTTYVYVGEKWTKYKLLKTGNMGLDVHLRGGGLGWA